MPSWLHSLRAFERRVGFSCVVRQSGRQREARPHHSAGASRSDRRACFLRLKDVPGPAASFAGWRPSCFSSGAQGAACSPCSQGTPFTPRMLSGRRKGHAPAEIDGGASALRLSAFPPVPRLSFWQRILKIWLTDPAGRKKTRSGRPAFPGRTDQKTAAMAVFLRDEFRELFSARQGAAPRDGGPTGRKAP